MIGHGRDPSRGGQQTARRRWLRGAFAAAACAVGRWPAALAVGTAAADEGVAVDGNTRLEAAGTAIDVVWPTDGIDQPRADVLAWIRASALAVVAYYGRFPMTGVRVELSRGRGGIHGETRTHNGTTTIRIALGSSVSVATMAHHWVMTHEFVHLAFPEVPDAHHWIEEGLATYVEPIARAQAGQLAVEEVWRQLVVGLPQGLPQAGDEGLDRTHTWGRTYWGGALFCLLADVGIRERSGNRSGLQDALRAIVAAGGNMGQFWPLEDALRIGDAAVGADVLTALHANMGARRAEIDLAALWRRLGVAVTAGTAVFDARAPLAAVREAITRPRGVSSPA